MNNNQPLTDKENVNVAAIAPQIVGGQEEMPADNANVSNNALNTFQEIEKADDNNKLAETLSSMNKDSSSAGNTSQTAASDFRLKILDDDSRLDRLFGNHDILDAISDLNAYKFRYKEGAQMVDPDATPDKERVGVMAQELKENPVTESTVEEDPLSGFLKVNTKELSLTTFALVTEMAKRIKALEERLPPNQ